MNPTPAHLNFLMNAALSEAEKALRLKEVPIGAVISNSDGIIAAAHNEMETTTDPTAHAERLAIQRAAQKIGNWRLKDSILCVTIEPCTMCIGAILLSRIPIIVFGAEDPKMGAVGSLYDLTTNNTGVRVIRGIESERCSELMKSFFKERRL